MSNNKDSSVFAKVASPENKQKWIRGLYLVLFLAIGYVSAVVILIVSILQFILDMIFGSPNKNLLDFSRSLTSYVYEVICYLGYISDKKPFPFNPWPK